MAQPLSRDAHIDAHQDWSGSLRWLFSGAVENSTAVHYFRRVECGTAWAVHKSTRYRAGVTWLGARSSPVTLPLRCPTCGQALNLLYQPQDDYQTVQWTCPYHGCRTLHAFELRGRIVRAVARYEPPS